MNVRILCAVLVLGLAGCSYDSSAPVSPALNVYSSFDEPLPGRYVLVVGNDDLFEEVKSRSYTCSAHNFPLDASDAFRTSVVRTFESLLEEVELAETTVSRDVLESRDLTAQIIVRSEGFQPRLTFNQGFWSVSADADVEMSASMQVDGITGRLLGTTAGADASEQGDAGGACGGGAMLLSDAAGQAIKELMERMGERLTNSQRVRDYAEQRQLEIATKNGSPSS